MTDTERDTMFQKIQAALDLFDEGYPLWVDGERIDVPPVIEGWLRVLMARVEAWEHMALMHDLVGPEQVSETLLQRAETIVKLLVWRCTSKANADQPDTPKDAMSTVLSRCDTEELRAMANGFKAERDALFVVRDNLEAGIADWREANEELKAELDRANQSAHDWQESFGAMAAERNTLARELEALRAENVALRNQDIVTSHLQREIDDLRRENSELQAERQKRRWACKSCGSMGTKQIDYPEGDWDMACLACGSVHTDETAEVLQVLADKVQRLSDMNTRLEGLLAARPFAPSNETAGTTRVGPRVQSFYHTGLGKY